MGFIKFEPSKAKEKKYRQFVSITKTGSMKFSKGIVMRNPELQGPTYAELFYDQRLNSIGVEIKSKAYKTKECVAITKANTVNIKKFMAQFEIVLLENAKYNIEKERDRALFIINLVPNQFSPNNPING